MIVHGKRYSTQLDSCVAASGEISTATFKVFLTQLFWSCKNVTCFATKRFSSFSFALNLLLSILSAGKKRSAGLLQNYGNERQNLPSCFEEENRTLLSASFSDHFDHTKTLSKSRKALFPSSLDSIKPKKPFPAKKKFGEPWSHG